MVTTRKQSWLYVCPLLFYFNFPFFFYIICFVLHSVGIELRLCYDCFQEDEITNLKKRIENLKEAVAEKEDKELTQLRTENSKLKYQIGHLEKVTFQIF